MRPFRLLPPLLLIVVVAGVPALAHTWAAMSATPAEGILVQRVSLGDGALFAATGYEAQPVSRVGMRGMITGSAASDESWRHPSQETDNDLFDLSAVGLAVIVAAWDSALFGQWGLDRVSDRRRQAERQRDRGAYQSYGLPHACQIGKCTPGSFVPAAIIMVLGSKGGIRWLLRILVRQKAEFVRWLREWQRWFYYHFAFGKDNVLSRRWAGSVTAWEQARRKGDVPVPEYVWDEQYGSGKWGFLTELEEVARYSVIAGYIAYLKPTPTIIDVGCGQGLLYRCFRWHNYAEYVGIDLSEVALRAIRLPEGERTRFIHADAESFAVETAHFDVVVFNESLYYFNEPLATFRRYVRSLKPEGIVIVSSYLLSQRAVAILNLIRSEYEVLDETRVTHGPRASVISVIGMAHQRSPT